MRTNIDKHYSNITNITLEELIPQYAANKKEMDDYKKICDSENAQIKQLMLDGKISEKSAGGYVAKCTVSQRETMNEEKLLEILHNLHQTNIPNVIKTKEYIDFDALEKAIYDGKVPEYVIMEMDKAKESTQVVTLRVTKEKEKK